MSPLTSADLVRVAGPLMISYLINWALFGVLSVQVYLYHLAFPNDQVKYKALVYVSFALESTQTILFGYSAFKTFVVGFGNPAVLDEVDIIWFSVPVLTGLVAFLSQSFYAYRVTVLAQTKYLGVLIMLLALLQLAGAIGTGAQGMTARLWSRYTSQSVQITTSIWEGGSAACDFVIAVSMIYYLKRRDTGVKQTQVLLARLSRLTMETGAMTAAMAIISLILGYLPGHPTYYQISCSALAKMYSNSMMVAFNSRMKISLANASTSAHEISIPLSQVPRTRNETGFDVEMTRGHGGVLITREEVSFPPKNDISDMDDKRVF